MTASLSDEIAAARAVEASIVVHDHPDVRPALTRDLAQLWLDAGRPWLALHYFEQHARLDGPADEVFESLMQAGHLLHQLHRPSGEVLDAFQRARAISSAPAQTQRVDDALGRVQTDVGFLP